MEGFKRNQMEEAISLVAGQGPTPTASLQTKLKRLLDTDRSLGRKPRSSDPDLANFAFYSDASPGRGSEVWFSRYEVFALLLALNLLEHGSTQGRSVTILRRARPALERKHAAMLKWDAADLFDQQKILDAAQEGSLAVSSTRPVFLVIATPKGPTASDGPEMQVAVLEQRDLVAFLRKPPGYLASIKELTRSAHDLETALSQTEPLKRGRGSA